MNTQARVNLYRRLLRRAKAELRQVKLDPHYNPYPHQLKNFWIDEDRALDWMQQQLDQNPRRYRNNPEQLVYDANHGLKLDLDLWADKAQQHPLWDLAEQALQHSSATPRSDFYIP